MGEAGHFLAREIYRYETDQGPNDEVNQEKKKKKSGGKASRMNTGTISE